MSVRLSNAIVVGGRTWMDGDWARPFYFDPGAVSGIQFWFNAEYQLEAVGDPIPTLLDASGGARDMSGAGGTIEDVGGKKVLRLSGAANNGYQYTGNLLLDSNDFTLMWVGKADLFGAQPNSFGAFFHSTLGDINNYISNTASVATVRWRDGANSFVLDGNSNGVAYSDSAFCLYECIKSGTSVTLKKDGVTLATRALSNAQVGTTAPASRTSYTWTMGNWNTLDRGLKGDIAQMLFYNVAVDGQDLSRLETWLKNQYGIA